MILGEHWFDIDGNEYEVVAVDEQVNEDGSIIRIIRSERISD